MYLCLEKGKEGRERGRGGEKHGCGCARETDWLPLTRPQLGTWPAAQACALTGNPTSNPAVLRLALNPLSHTNQGQQFFKM